MTTQQSSKIHPVVMYPFSHPRDESHLRLLYDKLIRSLDDDERYARPITVLNRQTWYRNTSDAWDRCDEGFKTFLETYVKKWSEIIDTWSVDTCQMWLAGLGCAYDDSVNVQDIYWLIPGDFQYATVDGRAILDKLSLIPTALLRTGHDLCLGEIVTEANQSKQLIDTYGTYGLLYNWFPREAKIIRGLTSKPRTEFFSLSHNYLEHLLNKRWYAYEHTLIMLLEGISGTNKLRSFHKEILGAVSDMPQGRDTLSVAMQQVERTERVLKLYWRERNVKPNWLEDFRRLEAQSEQIRGAALTILEQQL